MGLNREQSAGKHQGLKKVQCFLTTSDLLVQTGPVSVPERMRLAVQRADLWGKKGPGWVIVSCVDLARLWCPVGWSGKEVEKE